MFTSLLGGFKSVFILFFIILSTSTSAQIIAGFVSDKSLAFPLQGCSIILTGNKEYVLSSDTSGHFSYYGFLGGKYKITVSHIGYRSFSDSINVADRKIDMGIIYLQSSETVLNEVSIIEKVIVITQKNDTTEFDSRAYKTNPDADAVDMVKKMPGIDINNSAIKAQGNFVTKVLIDGKSFFGNDPYASLRNLPVEVIDKVQVYNEKSEQEQFTGFNEGNTTKTINIVTKRNKRNGIFGKGDAGIGDAHNYSAELSLNEFSEKQRITVTCQSNNVNIQNFTNPNGTTLQQGIGTTHTHAVGINYNDKWGRCVDFGGSYFFSETDNNASDQLQRLYLMSNDSGQVYNERNVFKSDNYFHRFNARINIIIDSANTLLLQPQLSIQKNYNYNSKGGYTLQSDSLINQTSSSNDSKSNSTNFSGSILYRHKFKKAGRTFSVNMAASNTYVAKQTELNALNQYFALALKTDTVNQQTPSHQNTWNLSANSTYTEQISKNSKLQLQYSFTYILAHAENNAYKYSYVTDRYTLQDTLLSNFFKTNSLGHKAGGSYQLQHQKWTASIGLYYQISNFANNQILPYKYYFSIFYQNLLPVASLQYRISTAKNLQLNYNTSTSVPSVTQLQNVINNLNPLHLTIGNSDLKQPFTHSITLRYNATNNTYSSTFYLNTNFSYTQRYITSSTIIAKSDTTVQQNTFLAKGSQLTMPINTDNSWQINLSSGYGIPIKGIRSNLNINTDFSLSNTPALINGSYNFQNTKTSVLTAIISSNISENIDFTIKSSTSITSSSNSLDKNFNSTMLIQTLQGNTNIIFKHGFLFNSQFTYQKNTTSSDVYNQSYLSCNVSVGKKIGKKRLADIKILAYDIFNQATNIQHSISDTFVQDTRVNSLHRYFMLLVNLKIRSFKNANT